MSANMQIDILVLGNIQKTKSKTSKIAWLALFLCGLIFTFYRAWETRNLYLKYPVVINIDFERSDNAEFPFVTVCNLNRISKTYEICIFDNITEDDCLNDDGNYNMVGQYLPESQNKALKNKAREFITKYAALRNSYKTRLGTQKFDFIQNCSFNGQICTPEYFMTNFNIHYGNCFTFTPPKNQVKLSNIDTISGLHMEMDLETYFYYEVISPTVGVKVFIHDSPAETNVEENGFVVSPGFETEVVTKALKIKRLPPPYKSSCKDYKSIPSSQIQCKNLCIQIHVSKICDCVDPTISEMMESYLPCNLNDNKYLYCLSEVLTNISTELLACDCPVACESTEFKNKISKTMWPLKAYNPQNYLLRENFAVLKIMLDMSDIQLFEEKPKYLVSEVLSNLGGDLGIFLGLSIVAFVEIIEIVIYILLNIFVFIKSNITTSFFIN